MERFSSTNSRSHGLDFSFVGVRSLWLGFNAASLPLSPPLSGAATPSHRSSTPSTPSFNLNFEEMKRLPRNPARDQSPSDTLRTPRATSPSVAAETTTKDFARACSAFNERRSGGRNSVVIPLSVGSKKIPERITALAVVGWDLSEVEIEDEVERLESIGKYERAAFCALFLGRIERSIEALDKSKGRSERARLSPSFPRTDFFSLPSRRSTPPSHRSHAPHTSSAPPGQERALPAEGAAAFASQRGREPVPASGVAVRAHWRPRGSPHRGRSPAHRPAGDGPQVRHRRKGQSPFLLPRLAI